MNTFLLMMILGSINPVASYLVTAAVVGFWLIRSLIEHIRHVKWMREMDEISKRRDLKAKADRENRAKEEQYLHEERIRILKEENSLEEGK